MKPLQRRRPNFGPALHPRTEQRIIFDLLWDDPDFRLASDLTTQWALKKRLQRGRKFLLLVTIFGTNVLHAVPEVSVRRLDLVSLEELNKLATGSVETVRDKSILGRINITDGMLHMLWLDVSEGRGIRATSRCKQEPG